VDAARAEEAVARYEKELGAWSRDLGQSLDESDLAEHRKFADGLADRALHMARGEAPRLGKTVSVTIIDDDVGGPYSIPPRDVFHAALRDAGGRVLTSGWGTDINRLVLVYAEPRSWKGRADLGARSLAQLEQLAPHTTLVILFAHPRLANQIPEELPVLCAWHGQALMQRAAARWVLR
jgi:hypothetical protein